MSARVYRARIGLESLAAVSPSEPLDSSLLAARTVEDTSFTGICGFGDLTVAAFVGAPPQPPEKYGRMNRNRFEYFTV